MILSREKPDEKRRWAWLAPVLVALVCAALLVFEDVDRHVRSAALLMRWTHAPGPERIRSFGEHAVTRQEFAWTVTPAAVPAHDAPRTITVVEYRPVDVVHPPPVLLVHGAHYRGMREVRLREFANAIASSGLLVFTPQLDELAQHHVQASTIGTLQQLARDAAKRAGYETAGVIGISFAGSLALLAAADESATTGSISSVTAVGSYASLDRVGRWYAGDAATGPDGVSLSLQPHPYGARVLFQAHAETAFGEHAMEFRRVLDLYLHDRPQQALEAANSLPEPTRQDAVALAGDAVHPLSDKLRSLLRVHASELARISPEHQLSQLHVPALLVHGADDPIIPSTETAWLARQVPIHALRASLITSAIRHAELQEEPSLADLWDLVHWAAALLEVSERQSRVPLMR